MRFQLVIQFEAALIENFDALIQVEDKLSASLGRVGYVDGHDFGRGEFNIFVLTDDAEEAFRLIQKLLTPMSYKAAYRDLQSDTSGFVILWPITFTDFEIT